MICTIHKDPVAFLDVCRPVLEANEALYNLMLGISIRLTGNPTYYGSLPLLATIVDGDRLNLAALMTPPHKLQLALFNAASSESVALLASEIHRKSWPVPGVIGEEPAAKTFAAHWNKLVGTSSRQGMRQRIYELRKVSAIRYPQGEFRQATLDDLDLVIKWSDSFYEDCFGDSDRPEVDDSQTRGMIEKGNLFFWDDSEPVSMAGLTRPTPHSISVSFVYTPPESRGKGYASAVTAKLSQLCLDRGREFCTLYTDLSNPTSNSIYQRIGYRPVADVTDIHFSRSRDDH